MKDFALSETGSIMDSRILGLAFFWEMVGAVGTKRGIAVRWENGKLSLCEGMNKGRSRVGYGLAWKSQQ